MEDLNQQQLQGAFNNYQSNQNDRYQQNGSQTNLKMQSKADIFNILNTEVSEMNDNDYIAQVQIQQLLGDEKIQPYQIKQIVQLAISPYLDRIRELEEIQQQKENQITALFYTVKKMDEIIKKIEAEQSKQSGSIRSTTTTNLIFLKGRKSTAVIPTKTVSTASGSTRSNSIARGASNLAQSTIVSSNTTETIQRKPSVPSLLDSRKSGINMSKSALHEPTSARGESYMILKLFNLIGVRNPKVNAATTKGKDGKETGEIKKVTKPEKKSSNENIQQAVEQKQKKQEPDTTKSSQQDKGHQNEQNQNTGGVPLQFLHDLNEGDNMSQKNDKQDDQNKNNSLNNSNVNDDSMLI